MFEAALNISQILCDMRTFIIWSRLFSKKSSNKWNLSCLKCHRYQPSRKSRYCQKATVSNQCSGANYLITCWFFKIRGHMFWASFLKQSGTGPTDELLWLPKYFPGVKRSQTTKPLCALRTLKFMFILFTNKNHRWLKWKPFILGFRWYNASNDLIILIQS